MEIRQVYSKNTSFNRSGILSYLTAVLKRGKGTGFSGVENPLFTNDNTVMIYGDAKATVSALVSEFADN